MTWNRTKLLAAGLMVAGGLGIGGLALRTAEGQAPAAKEPAPAAKPAEPAAATAPVPATGPGRVAWEYRYNRRPTSIIEFIKLLDEYGAEGWEYMDYSFPIGVPGVTLHDEALSELAKANPSKFRNLGGDGPAIAPTEIVVFKRPKTTVGASTSVGDLTKPDSKEVRQSTTTAEEAVQLAKVQYEVALVQAEEAKKQLDVARALKDHARISATELRDAETKAKLTELQVAEARIRLQFAERRAAEAKDVLAEELDQARNRYEFNKRALASYQKQLEIITQLRNKGQGIGEFEFMTSQRTVEQHQQQMMESEAQYKAAQRQAASAKGTKP